MFDISASVMGIGMTEGVRASDKIERYLQFRQVERGENEESGPGSCGNNS